MSESKEALDLSYRPASYFWPITHETHAIAAIKGERRRNALTLTISPDWDSGGSPGSVFRLTATYEFALLWDVLGAPTATLEVYAQSSVSN